MAQVPATDEVGAALGRFFFSGDGPSHSTLSNVFVGAGYGSDDPYLPATQAPNKEIRVRTVVSAAKRRPERARELIDGILMQLRVNGSFDPQRSTHAPQAIKTAQAAFRRAGWTLTDDGILTVLGGIDLSTGGRSALDEQLDRLRRATEDPGQLLGSAKDLLEAVAKFVLEELGVPAQRNASFDHLWYLARERLGVLPEQVDPSLPGANNIKAILQSAWKIAEQTNQLRGMQGAGHGRTLPTGVSAELALLVVREACSVAEYTLLQLDRHRGRR